MGGDLTFESVAGAGTSFYFTARFGADADQPAAGARRPVPTPREAGTDRGGLTDQP